jgi:hypothetical protein
VTDKQLIQSFKWCKLHTDPDAWEALAIAYLERGYKLNALYCHRQAEAIRAALEPA